MKTLQIGAVLAQSPRLSTKCPHLVEGGVHSTWLQDVQIPAETQKLQAETQTWNKQTFGNIFEAQNN
jgi:hypothetical protein